MAAKMLAATMPAEGPVSAWSEAAAPPRARLFLGPVPDKQGLSAPQPKDFEDSYRDIREQYGKKAEFQSEFELVDDIDQADLALEITARGLRDTGDRHQASIVHGKRRRDPDVVVPGASSPINEKTLSARLLTWNRTSQRRSTAAFVTGHIGNWQKMFCSKLWTERFKTGELCRTANSGFAEWAAA